MKIGIFDSGLGGLLIARAIRHSLPKYDYVYLGDTKRVPYGNRSHDAVYEFTKECVDYLFEKENCGLVILACNTASARALGKLQKNYFAQNFPSDSRRRKILGVLIPTAEEAAKFSRVGVLATAGTVTSGSFPKEIGKINKKVKVFQNDAPLLVPLAEEGEKKLAEDFIKKYLRPILREEPKAIVLGCTHYPFFKKEIRRITGGKVKIISQDEIIPVRLQEYLRRHPEIRLSQNKTAKILVTDMTQNVKKLSAKWFGKKIKPRLIKI